MKKLLVILGLFSMIFPSCKKNENAIKVTKPEIDGVVQKGPFLNGTSIDIFELKDDFTPTGKTFSAQITDNSGSFALKNVSLTSQYIQLKADGYYFNEITGQNSNSPITLYALTDITNKNSVNINILSNLEKGRIEYLLTKGLSFSDAKKQAEQEILKIFSISKNDITDFDMLNISQDGDNNAILLAISLITQGYRTEAELSDLMANISTDTKEDGILNSASISSLLINDARLFNLPEIRKNIETRYANLGMTVTIPNFEKYIKTFVDSTKYQISNNIVYPEYSNYGENILFGDKVTFSSGLSLAANLPKGTSLKIIIKGGMWAMNAFPNGPVNWSFNMYDNQTQTFTAKESGKNCDLVFSWMDLGIHTIEYYENNAIIPTRVKIISN